MELLKRMVSVKRDRKSYFVCPPNTMTYLIARSGSALSQLLRWSSMEFGIGNGMRRRRSFFRKLFCSAYSWSQAKNICDRITSRIELWNKGAYDELIQDSYGETVASLGKSRRTQNQKQLRGTLSNLILIVKLREAARFIYEQEKGGFLIPGNWETDKTCIADKTVAEVLTVNINLRENPIILRWRRTRNGLFLFQWILQRMWLTLLRGNFQGAQVPVAQTWRLYRGG